MIVDESAQVDGPGGDHRPISLGQLVILIISIAAGLFAAVPTWLIVRQMLGEQGGLWAPTLAAVVTGSGTFWRTFVALSRWDSR